MNLLPHKFKVLPNVENTYFLIAIVVYNATDAIFIVRQLQEKHLAANKPLYMAFIDLEKAFDRVPLDVIWWAMRKLGIDEWLVRLVQSMYKDVRSRVRVGDGYSEEFGVGVGVHLARCSLSLC